MNDLPKTEEVDAGLNPLAVMVADRLLEARKIIERDFALPLTLQRLARHARLPHLTFNRAYREAFGMAPMDHVRLLRLSEAARLLASGASVAEIASRVGYPNPASFKAEFRRVFGGGTRINTQLDIALQDAGDASGVAPKAEGSSTQ